MNEEICKKVENVQEETFDETQMHAWIHPNGWFEMNIKAKDQIELDSIVKFVSTILERY